MKEEKKIKNAVELLIANGQVIPDEFQKTEKKTISLTMNDYFLRMIDCKVAEREGISRNAWILNAIQEKIEREG